MPSGVTTETQTKTTTSTKTVTGGTTTVTQTTTQTTTETVTVGPEPIKVAMVFEVSPDISHWDKGGLNGLELANERYGIEYTTVEYVTREENERTLRLLATEGFDIIFSHGTLTLESVAMVAPDFPDTLFGVPYVSPTFEHPPGVFTYSPSSIQNAYLAGIIAGSMTETNRIGAQTGFIFPSIIASIEAFKLGAKSVNPGQDPAKGKETANALIDQGCDFFRTFASGVDIGVIQAVEENDLWFVATEAEDVGDISDKCLATGIYSFEMAIADVIGEYLVRGTLENRDYYGGVERGWADIVFNRPDVIPDDIQETVLNAKQQMITGQLVVPWIYELTPA
jgi:basic membrane protein A